MNYSKPKKLENELIQHIEELGQFYAMADESPIDESSLYNQLSKLTHRYCIGELIDKGGGKMIYKAEDLQSGREVAFAQMFAEDAKESVKKESFLREARITATLQHPNIMPVYDVGVAEDGMPFFTMKLVKNKTLATILKKIRINPAYRRIYPHQVLLEIFVKICEAIAYAHSKGVLHLDLKPENILIGEFGEVLVADWGLGKVIGTLTKADKVPTNTTQLDSLFMGNITLHGLVKGTIGYMSPEQLDKRLGSDTPASDIYSLGALLYTMLTNHLTIEAKTLHEYKEKLFSGKIVAPSECNKKLGIPASLDAVCLKALQTKPSNRYPTVTALTKDIHAYLAGFATQAENAGFLKSLTLICLRHKYLTFFMLFLILVSVAIREQRLKVEDAKRVANEQTLRLKLEQLETKKFFELNMLDNVEKTYANFITSRHENNWSLVRYLERVDKDNEILNELKCKLYFVENRFDEVIKICDSLGGGFNDLLNLAKKYRKAIKPNKRPSIQDCIVLCKELHNNGRVSLTYQYMSFWIKKYSIGESELLLKEVLQAFNKIHGGEVNVKLTNNKEGFSLDLSNNKRLYDLKPLILLPITELDIHRTNIPTAEDLSQLPLKKVVMNSMMDWRPLLKIRDLQEIVVTRSNASRKFLYKFKEKGIRITIKQ